MDERYQNGKIYKLTCDDPTMVYYGSTIKTLAKRLTIHKAPSNKTVSRKMRDVGGLQIELLEDYPCNSKKELEQREQYYIANNECINFKDAFHTEEQKLEYIKKYREANREKHNENKRIYREANRDKINTKQREKRHAIKTIN
jgi:GIY-YIG catalytic domain